MEKELKKEDKNQDFVQLYRNNLDNLVTLSQNPTAFKLFMLIVKHMDGMNALTVSTVALTEILQVSRATVCRAIKFLKDNGYMAVMKSGTTNVYIINPDVAWTSYGYQKQYCRFQSNVLLVGSENAEYLDNPKASYRIKTIDEDFIRTVQANRENFEQSVDDMLANSHADRCYDEEC